MENKKFARELENRTKIFAVQIRDLSTSLSNSIEGSVVKSQLTKSGTSIGVNYREANRSRSFADFKNRICESETSETQ